jgi:integrase
LPTPQNVTVRSPRPRDYLTEREVEKLMDAARENRWGHRDATARAGEAAKFPFLISSHRAAPQLRVQAGQRRQDTRAIQHYLGHRSIASTVRYTKLAPDRFKGFWED